MSYEPPLKVTIPIPSKIPLSFGPNSTGKRGGNLRVRCTNKEYDLIQDEAAALDLSLANFCRWSALYVARAIKEHREDQSTSMSAGEELDGRNK